MKMNHVLLISVLLGVLSFSPTLLLAERGAGGKGGGYGERSEDFPQSPAGASANERERERHVEPERENVSGDREQEKERHRERRTEEEMKELGKGSEQGQASREEHRRKWWRFWE